MPEWPQPVRTTRPWPRTFATSAWSSRISGSGCQPRRRWASWTRKPRSNSVVRSTSPVTSSEPSSRNEGCRSSTISKPAPSSAGLLVVGQLDRLAAREGDPAPAPELGVDQHRQVRPAQPAHQPVHPGGVVPVAVAQHDDVDVAGREAEPAHVLDQAVGRDPASNRTRVVAAAFVIVTRQRSRARRAARRPCPPSRAGRDRGGGAASGLGPSRALVGQQRVGHVVHQRGDQEREGLIFHMGGGPPGRGGGSPSPSGGGVPGGGAPLISGYERPAHPDIRSWAPSGCTRARGGRSSSRCRSSRSSSPASGTPPRAGAVPVMLDVSHMTSGYALRMRYSVQLDGPCMRCLEDAGRAPTEVDAREVDQPGGGEDLTSPYLDGLISTCRPGPATRWCWRCRRDRLQRRRCKGLCAVCGENLNEAGAWTTTTSRRPTRAGRSSAS